MSKWKRIWRGLKWLFAEPTEEERKEARIW